MFPFSEKPPEYWAILAGAFLILMVKRIQGIPVWKHFVNSAAAALLTIGLSPSLASFIYGGELGAAVLCMFIAVPTLNVLAAMAEDKKWVRGIIERLLGKNGGGPDV